MRLAGLLAITAAAAFTISACGDDEPTANDATETTAASNGGDGETITVEIGEFMFEPTPIEVSVGDSVVWENVHNQPHTASGNGDQTWDTANISPATHPPPSPSTRPAPSPTCVVCTPSWRGRSRSRLSRQASDPPIQRARGGPVQISAKELRQLASDVDDMHREAMSTFREEAAELHLESIGGSRRRFLKNAGLAGAGATLITVGGPLHPSAGSFPPPPRGLTDTIIAGYAQSIELAAVAAYAAAAGALPSDVRPVGELFAGHHQEHADAFGAVAGDDARPRPTRRSSRRHTDPGDGGRRQRRGRRHPQVRPRHREPGRLHLRVRAHRAAGQGVRGGDLDHPPGRGEPRHRAHHRLGRHRQLFPTGAFEVAVVGDGTDPRKGLDPAVFG